MMNGGMPASGGGGHMGQMGGQIGMNPMVMGRMPMGPDQVCAKGDRSTASALSLSLYASFRGLFTLFSAQYM